MGVIEDIKGIQVVDSRGTPTLYVEVKTSSGAKGYGYAPSGASTGKREAVELRDSGAFLGGKGVTQCLTMLSRKVLPALRGVDVSNQEEVDRRLSEADGTPNFSSIGSNTSTAVSIACCRAAAAESGVEVYALLSNGYRGSLPSPMLNLINGGKHAGNSLSVQEFMVVPDADSFSEALWRGVEIYRCLKEVIKDEMGAAAVNVGDEGGFAPPYKRTEQALAALSKASEKAGMRPGSDVYFALDCAASSFKRGSGYFVDGSDYSSEKLLEYYASICDAYPIVSIEDPFHEDDWESFQSATHTLRRVRVIGDDLFVTDSAAIRKGLAGSYAGGAIIKVNQVGTVSSATRALRVCRELGGASVVSHRSGDTVDPYIAHFAAGLNSDAIKSGAPARGERVAKYNELLRIESLGVADFKRPRSIMV